MLTLSRQALSVIQRISRHPATSDTAGLRISDGGGQLDADPSSWFGVAIVEGPARGDSLVERDGARLYLSPAAARELSGRKLDVAQLDEGTFKFVLKDAS